MSVTPGQIGRYRVVRQLASGGMGAMYLAHDPAIDRHVAIKMLRDGGDSGEFRARFAREARAIGALRHSNIVTVFDIGEHEDIPYMVMEYVAGESLAQLIARRAPLPLSRKLQIVEDLCRGLAHAHQQGVVHRDVKPANVMLDEGGGVKILDFGIAQLVRTTESSLTQVGAVFGTLNYLPPEMLAGSASDHRADIYGVGALGYELIGFEKLYAGTLADGVLHRIMNGTHAPLATVVPDLPADLDAIIERSIALDPGARYQDLQEMASDLAQCRATLPADLRVPALSGAADPAAVESVVEQPTRLGVVAKHATERAQPGMGDATVFLPGSGTRGQPAGEAAADARLLVAESPDALEIGRVIPLSRRSITLGRGSECDVVMRDVGWSRRHAAIEWQDGGYTIRDLGSRNGTFVNGRRVRPDRAEPLFFGVSIGIGDTRLTFSSVQESRLPDLRGVEIAGRYLLEELLRESTKAALYIARDRHVPRRVAIKLLSPHLAQYAGYREQFRREAQMAAQLQHPNVARVLDSGETALITREGRQLVTHFLCLEAMAGGSLAARLSAQQLPTIAEIREWIGRLASALQYVHEQGIIHGDLKPSAIVFDDAGHVYLSDFAIAQQALSSEGAPPPGSPAFMAPELWDGAPATPASDQFGLAVLAYYLVTGSRPFEGQDNPEIRRKNLRRGPVPAHQEAAQNGRASVARAVSDVLQRALHVSPQARYETVRQFGDAFTAALSGARRTGTAPLVFVSYERELSGGWARFFADRLQQRFGIQVFLDTVGLDRAGRFPPRLARAIEDCDVFICFLARQTLESVWVNEEIRLASTFGKVMIPVFQESYIEPVTTDEHAPVKDLLAHQGIKLFDVSGYYVEDAVEHLARLVQGAASDDPSAE